MSAVVSRPGGDLPTNKAVRLLDNVLQSTRRIIHISSYNVSALSLGRCPVSMVSFS